jgi:hypothetical protein
MYHASSLLVVSICLTATNVPAAELICTAAQDRVGRYERIEFDITAPTDYANPFDPEEVALTLELTAPDGTRLDVPAYFSQPFEHEPLGQGDRQLTWMYPSGTPVWKGRFAPAVIGRYTARALLVDRRGTVRSEPVAFECVPSISSGFVRVSRTDARFFETDDAKPFFPIGQNLAFIGEGQFVTLARAEQILGRLQENGANYIRVWAGCHDWAIGIEARKSAFGRSWSWRPPFAPHPDDSDRQCVRLAGEAGSRVEVDPSHRVALRPNTRYVLSGRVRTEGNASLNVEVGSRRLASPACSTPESWTEWRIEFDTAANERWLRTTNLCLADAGTAWVDSLSLVEATGGAELLWEADPNRPARGVYNQVDCFMLDQVLAAAEQHQVRIQLTLLTRDLYMDDLADEASPTYQGAIGDAKKIFRYAVARWGYSTSVAVWEYFNEIDPNLPTDRFYRELGEYLDDIDPYRHLRSTSTWHPSPRDWKLPQLDLADQHFYLRPDDYKLLRDEVDAVGKRVALLRQHAANKPALLGEFGLANERWQPTEEMQRSPEVADFHNGIWASALSGTSGTAMFWWWDRLHPRDHYAHYRPLADFLAGISWTTANLQPARASVRATGTPSEIVPVGLAAHDRAYLWLFDTAASWKNIAQTVPTPVRKADLVVEGLDDDLYRVRWWHTREGRTLEETSLRSEAGRLRLSVPDFERDIACRIEAD